MSRKLFSIVSCSQIYEKTFNFLSHEWSALDFLWGGAESLCYINLGILRNSTLYNYGLKRDKVLYVYSYNTVKQL